MKKLLSAVTSAVMSLSLVTGAFTSSVSAAGSFAVAQPNVSMGEIKDVTANKQAGETAVFDLGNYEAKAGETIDVDIKIDTNGVNIATADINLAIDSPLKITEILKKSPAINGTVSSNINALTATFTNLDTNGDPKGCDPDKAAFMLSVEVPANTADGTYNLTLTKHEAFLNGSGAAFATSVVNGKIKVGAGGADTSAQPTTTKATTTAATTTKTPGAAATTAVQNPQASNAEVVFDLGSYTAKAGDTIDVDIKVDAKGANLACTDINLAIDSPLEITEILKKSPAINGTVSSNIDALTATFTNLDTNGDPKGIDATKAAYMLSVKVPDGTANGTYYLKLTKHEAFKNGGGEEYSTSVINGDIKVGGGDNTPAQTTTKAPEQAATTTSKPQQSANAEVVFDLGSYTAKAGETIDVDIKVDAKGANLACTDINLAIDSPLKITEILKKSPAINGTVSSNIDALTATFTNLDTNGDPKGIDATKAAYMLSVEVPAGTADGTYYITLTKHEAFKNGGGDEFTTAVINGDITVGDGGNTPAQTTTKAPEQAATTTSKPQQSANAEVVFDLGSYTAKAGDIIDVDIKVDAKGANLACTDINLAIDSPLKITEILKKSPAINGTVSSNIDALTATFTNLDTNGDPKGIDATKAAYMLSVEVPAGTADGTYYITLTKHEAFKNGGGDEFTTAVINGDITVGGEPSAPEKEITFTFGNYEAKPGETVDVDVFIDTNGQPIGGVDAIFAIDSPLEITEILKKSNAANTTVASNVAELSANFTCTDADGEGIVPKTDAAVFMLTVKVPENAEPGKSYSIAFGSKLDVVKNGKELYSGATTKAGSITIKGDSSVTTVSTSVGSTTTSATSVGSSTTTVSDVPMGTTTATPVSGTAEWVIPVVNAAPGEKVSMPVVVKNSAVEVAGAQFNVTAKAPIEYSAVASGDAYGATVVKNDSEKMFAFANTSGAGVKAANDAVIYTLTYTVPADCAEGEYDVTWSNAFISDTNGLDITKNITLTNGKIIVKKGAAPVSGNIKWVLGNETAKPGDTVTLKAVVSDANGDKVPVAGAQFKVNADSPIAYSTIASGTAYGFPITNNDAETFFAFANVTGAGAAAADGSTIFTLMYKVPEDCADGVYNVKWADGFISDTNGTDITSSIEFVDGTITVKKDADHPTTTGSVEWVIPVEEAEPGDTVTMLVKVKGTSDLPVAGAQFGVNAATPIEYTLASGTPYGATLVVNDDAKEFAFANTSGAGTTAADGATLFTIVYKVPENCADGEYPVVWDAQFVSDTFGKDITKNVTFTDGKIIVKGTTTITSSTTESTTTTTVTTESTTTTTVTTVSTPTDTTTVSSSSTTATTTVGPNPGTTTTNNNGNPNTTTTIVIVPPAEIAWVVDTVYANPGDTVNVNVVVVDPDAKKLGVAGAQFTITNEQPPVLDSVSDAKNGYSSSVVFNKATNEYAFAVENGANVPSVNGTYVATLTYKVPEDCAAGTYKVDLGNVLVFAEDGKDITDFVQIVDGAIIVNAVTTQTTVSGSTDTTASTTVTTVSGSTDTTASTTVTTVSGGTDTTASTTVTTVSGGTDTTASTTVTTVSGGTDTTASTTVTTVSGGTDTTESTTVSGSTDTTASTTVTTVSGSTDTTASTTVTTVTAPTGSIIWDIDDVTAMPGDTVHVKVIVKDPNGTKLPVAGAEFGIVNGEAIGKPGESGDVNGYGQKIVFNPNTVEAAFANPNGTVSIAEDGSMVIDLVYTIPSDCAEGTYPIDFSGLKVFGENGVDLTKNILPMGGSITVGEVITTSTTTTTSPDPTSSTTTITTSTEPTTSSTEPTTTSSTTTITTSTESTTSSTEPTTTSSTTTITTSTESTTSSTEPTTTSSTTSESTGSSTEPPVSETTTTETTPIDPTTTSVYYSIESVPGYYFSHDDGRRGNNEPGGFAKGQITSITKHIIENGVETTENLDLSGINYGGATPNSVYTKRFGGTTVNENPQYSDFVYSIPVFNGTEALLDVDGNALSVTAYIGVKGDTNLDSIVDARDASEVLTYYANASTDNADKEALQLSTSKWVSSGLDDLDDLAAFLGDVDANEWDENNWSVPKQKRKLDAVDATGILTFYACSSATDSEYGSWTSYEIWNEVVPYRFGER